MEPESKQQILERRKEIEQKLVDMLKETDPTSPRLRRGKEQFSLQDVRDAIFHEEDNDDMIYPHTKLKLCTTLTFWKVKKIYSFTLALQMIFAKDLKSIMMAKFFQPKLDDHLNLFITKRTNLKKTREKEKRVWSYEVELLHSWKNELRIA